MYGIFLKTMPLFIILCIINYVWQKLNIFILAFPNLRARTCEMYALLLKVLQNAWYKTHILNLGKRLIYWSVHIKLKILFESKPRNIPKTVLCFWNRENLQFSEQKKFKSRIREMTHWSRKYYLVVLAYSRTLFSQKAFFLLCCIRQWHLAVE